MIQVTLYRTLNNGYRGFDIKGHAGYAPEGRDVVCAAVSAISYTALGGLLNLVDPDIEYTVDEGWISLTVPADLAEDCRKAADIILETMKIGLLQIQQKYDKYICVRELVEEV